MNDSGLIIAIDGPAGSGKSTTARAVARRLGYLYIDSGAMYRAVTLLALRRHIPVADEDAVAVLARELRFRFERDDHHTRLLVDGEDVSDAIRLPEVTDAIAPVAANPAVREVLVARQRELAAAGGIVMDGRDIGTVVFPHADVRVFMVATVEERARRRVAELAEKGVAADYEAIRRGLIERDRNDSGRAHGPLKAAPDAVEVDTTALSIEAQADVIEALAREVLARR